MDIKPCDKTIKELLGSERQFVIPRFQREYSWEKKNYREFLEDMINCLSIKDGNININSYFLGTMLFVGDYTEGADKEIDVVDGQQRLTIITILFSVLSDYFIKIGNNTLSERVFEYIMANDVNGNDVRILKSKTHYPYFAYFIQDRNKAEKREPSSDEELNIQESYNFFCKQLEENSIREYLKKKPENLGVDLLKYEDILKAIRDQVLNSTFVSISTKDKSQANMIFEILNGKGKQLTYIDLIKNKIFGVLRETEPVDLAEDYWKKTKEMLSNGTETIGMATFYRHYWISKYKKSTSANMYDDFNKNIKKNDQSYKDFIVDMYENSKNYMKIINPRREDNNNRKEYFWLVQSLNVINNYFNIVQVRIALLALFELKNKSIIDHKIFKDTILYLEAFHFAFTAIVSGRSNRFESIYSAFAIALRKCNNKEDAKKIITNNLINLLDNIFPAYTDFSTQFIKVSYTKKDNPSNVKAKYIINKLNCYYSGDELFADNGSIEHINPEKESLNSTNIGNLILLEGSLNNIDDNSKKYEEKKGLIYGESNYKWIADFVQNHSSWNETMIADRASELANIYYYDILKRPKTPNK